MRITKEVLEEKIAIINSYTQKQYKIVYQNGYVYLKDNAYESIAVTNTKPQMALVLDVIQRIVWREIM